MLVTKRLFRQNIKVALPMPMMTTLKRTNVARKACNYITASVEDCGNIMIGNCHSEEEIDKKKDEQIMKVLEVIKTNIKGWDSRKCPAVQQHIDNVRGKKTATFEASRQQRQSSSSISVSIQWLSAAAVVLTRL